MRKTGLYIGLAIWIFISVRFIYGISNENYSFTEVLGKSHVSNIEGSIEAYGEYGITHLTDEEKSSLIASIASCVGINSQYTLNTVENGDTVTVTLQKNSKNADVSIRLVTVTDKSDIIYEARQYIGISMKFNNGDKYLMSYKELIENIFEEEDIDGNVNMCLTGNIDTVLNIEERKELASSLLKRLSANIVLENNTDDMYTIYAYTNEIEDFIVSAGKKINVNIALTYNEQTDCTVIYLASPLNNLDY